MNDPRDIQDAQYNFPYHFLPHCDQHGVFRPHRFLPWGNEYLCYMLFIRERVLRKRPRSLLDVGCGDGRLLSMLNGHVPRLAGIDPSEQAVHFARAFNANCDISLGRVGSVEERFDCVTLVEVLEHIPDHEVPRFVQDIAARLHTTGNLLVSVPTTNTPIISKHFRHYDLDSLKAQLAPSFRIVDHWWIWHCGWLQKFLRLLAGNRLYLINSQLVLRFLWRFQVHLARTANSATGAHLIAAAELEDR